MSTSDLLGMSDKAKGRSDDFQLCGTPGHGGAAHPGQIAGEIAHLRADTLRIGAELVSRLDILIGATSQLLAALADAAAFEPGPELTKDNPIERLRRGDRPIDRGDEP